MKVAIGLLFAALGIGVVQAETIETRAQDYIDNQNVESGARTGYGDCIVTREPGNLPTSAKYKVKVKDEGNYHLKMTYAAGVPRPVSITVNGQFISGNAASGATGGFFPGNQITSNEGVVRLKAGENLVLISRDSDFPHIHSFTVEGPQP